MKKSEKNKKFEEQKKQSGKKIAPLKAKIESSKPKKSPSLLGLKVEKYSLWIFVGLLLVIIVAVFKDYLLGDKYYIFKDIGSDTENSFYPFFVQLHNVIKEGVPKWSFYQGMGEAVGNGVITFFTYPFQTFLYIFGNEGIACGIVYMEVSKIIIASIIFFFYLRELKLTPLTTIVGALLFGFSGFMIIGSGWYSHTYEMIFAALLLLTFEKFFQKNFIFALPLVIALFFREFGIVYLFLYVVFIVVYSVFRFIESQEWNWKKFLVFHLKFLGIGVLAMALNAPQGYDYIVSLFSSERVSGSLSQVNSLSSGSAFGFAEASHNITALLRFFGNDMLGGGKMSSYIFNSKKILTSEYRGWYNFYEAPMFYTGLISLLLLPQIFVQFSKRKKIVYSSFLFIWILPVIFPYLRHALWGFSGDYYRTFSFFVLFAFLFLGLQVFCEIDKQNKINLPVLGITLVVLLIILHFPFKINDIEVINNNLNNIATVFLILYAITFAGLNVIKNNLFIIKLFIVFLVCAELIAMSYSTVNKRAAITKNEFHSRVGYNDYSIDAINYLKSIDKNFYRINKDYTSGSAVHGSINDAMVQGYYGITCYKSFQQPYFLKFLLKTGVIKQGDEGSARWAMGLMDHYILQTVINVKYNLSKSNRPNCVNYGYKAINKFNDVVVLANPFYLPLGYTYDSYMDEKDFAKLNYWFQKEMLFLRGFILNDQKLDVKDFKKITENALKDTAVASVNFDYYKSLVDSLRRDTLQITAFSQNKIEGQIATSKKKLLFFSIPFDEGWTATVDGKTEKLSITNFGFMGLVLAAGKHQIVLNYNLPPYNTFSVVIMFLAIAVYLFLIYWIVLRKKYLTSVNKI